MTKDIAIELAINCIRETELNTLRKVLAKAIWHAQTDDRAWRVVDDIRAMIAEAEEKR